MATTQCGEEEQKLYRESILQDSRLDGRNKLSFREITYRLTYDSNPNPSIEISLGKTTLAGTISLKVGDVLLYSLDSGVLRIFVKSFLSHRAVFYDDVANNLQAIYSSPDCIDLDSLIIIPGSKCWHVYIDIVVMVDDGNVMDAAGFAVRELLSRVKIPNVEVENVDGSVEYDVDDDLSHSTPIDIKHLPVVITSYIMDDIYFYDPTLIEQTCSPLSVSIGICPKRNIVSSMHMNKYGYLSLNAFNEISTKTLEHTPNLMKVLNKQT